jgi:aspartate/glutamate racemase
MTNESRKNINKSPDQVDTETDVSRREFLTKSTSTIAAAGAIAAGASLLSGEASAAWPKKSDVEIPSDLMPVVDVDPAERFRIRQGDLFYEKHGYADRIVTGWKGRSVYGATVGIIQLPANIPMLPGDMGNPTTFKFPVLYELIPDIDPFWVLSAEPHPEVLKRTIIAAHRLEMQGCRAIIGNCGFFANYQPEVAQAITVPFFNGSLMQVPMALIAVGSNKKVGVLTANGELLKASPALKNSGVHDDDMDRVVIVGNEDGKEMNKITGETGTYSPQSFEKELVDLAVKMVEDHPDIGAIVLECTEFPPHAHAIQEATRLPMYDFTTLTNLMHAGAMRAPFTGWM